MRFERKIGEFTVAAYCDDDLAMQAKELLATLDELHQKGPKLREGTTIRFGWSKLRLVTQGDTLIVCEPDFSGNALKNVVPEVDRTLRIIKAQAVVCKVVDTVGPNTFFDQTMVVAKEYLQTPHIYLDRRESQKAESSGWYLGPFNMPDAPIKAKDLELLYTYELVARRPAVLKILNLPVNHLVVFDGDRIEKLFDANGNNLWLDSE